MKVLIKCHIMEHLINVYTDWLQFYLEILNLLPLDNTMKLPKFIVYQSEGKKY